MKTFAVLSILAVCLCASTQALTTKDLLDYVVKQQDDAFQTMTGTLSKPSEKGAYALIKYVVVPSKAKGFIELLEEAKKDASEFKGYKAYDLVKTLDDNISYIAWAAWETPEDLVEYIKSDASKKVIEYISKEDIVALISAVKPVV